jgi:uncharacterized protein YndB with AHSA1/START domain
MTETSKPGDGRLDLTITRLIDVPRPLVWKVWTTPEHLKKWWAPKPVETTECEIDLRPGGAFRTVMRLPDGQEMPVAGVYLEVVENRRLVFTDTLQPGWRPSQKPFFTAILEIADEGGRTRYTATALHKDEADRATHESWGFDQGWNKALDQLVEVAAALKAGG